MTTDFNKIFRDKGGSGRVKGGGGRGQGRGWKGTREGVEDMCQECPTTL